MPDLTITDYQNYANKVRELTDSAERKAAMIILSGEIRRTIWPDDSVIMAATLASELVTEAIRIDASPLDALRALLSCHGHAEVLR